MNREFLIEELNPKSLIDFMSTQDVNIDKAREVRRRDPFNREGQVKALLDVLSNRSFEFFKHCMESSRQQKYIIDKIDSFNSTLKSTESSSLDFTVRNTFANTCTSNTKK